MQDNFINLELDTEVLNKVQNKVDNLIKKDNSEKVWNENLSLLAFEKYLRASNSNLDIDITSIPDSLEDETKYRRELFNLNYLKVNNQYVNVIPVLDPSKKEFFIPKNIFDSLHHADTFSFIYITPLKTSAYLLGYLTYDDIDSNKISFDNHFYKLNILNLKTNIQDLLNISTSRTISDSINNQEKKLIEVDLKKQLNELNSFRNDSFVDELYYQPKNHTQSFLRYDSLSKLYLEAQNVFQENMQLKNFSFASDLANSLYEHYKNNKNNFENLIDNNFDNSSIRYFNNLLITELENIKAIFRSIEQYYLSDTIINLKSILESNLSNNNLFNNILIDFENLNQTNFSYELSSIDEFIFILEKELKNFYINLFRNIETYSNLSFKKNDSLEIYKDIYNSTDDEKYIELKSVFTLILKIFLNKNSSVRILNNLELSLIVDSIFFILEALKLENINYIIDQLTKRSLSIISFLLSKNIETEIKSEFIFNCFYILKRYSNLLVLLDNQNNDIKNTICNLNIELEQNNITEVKNIENNISEFN